LSRRGKQGFDKQATVKKRPKYGSEISMGRSCLFEDLTMSDWALTFQLATNTGAQAMMHKKFAEARIGN
jgi:hypothetical protein